MSVIIGLDISLNHPGWCRIDTANGARTLDTFDYTSLSGLRRIHKGAWDLIELCRPADLVIMEGLSMGLPTGKNGRSFVPQGRSDLVGLTYVVRLWLWKNQKQAFLMSPLSLKKFATGERYAKKDVMLREVYRRWGVLAADDNQADALALAEAGRAYLDPASYGATTFQKEAIKKLQCLQDDTPTKKSSPRTKKPAAFGGPPSASECAVNPSGNA